MKKLLFSLTALVCSTVLFAQTGKKASDVAKFESESIDLGKIKQDVPATATFTVTNISKEPLIIEQANPTCGCTIGNYTKEPIAPGKTGIITATYNAKNLNAFEKHMTVKFAGVDEVTSITIKGEVLNPDDYAKMSGASEVKVAPATVITTEKQTTTVTKQAVKKPAVKKSTTTKTVSGAPSAKS